MNHGDHIHWLPKSSLIFILLDILGTMEGLVFFPPGRGNISNLGFSKDLCWGSTCLKRNEYDRYDLGWVIISFSVFLFHTFLICSYLLHKWNRKKNEIEKNEEKKWVGGGSRLNRLIRSFVWIWCSILTRQLGWFPEGCFQHPHTRQLTGFYSGIQATPSCVVCLNLQWILPQPIEHNCKLVISCLHLLSLNLVLIHEHGLLQSGRKFKIILLHLQCSPLTWPAVLLIILGGIFS